MVIVNTVQSWIGLLKHSRIVTAENFQLTEEGRLSFAFRHPHTSPPQQLGPSLGTSPSPFKLASDIARTCLAVLQWHALDGSTDNAVASTTQRRIEIMQ